MKPFNEYHDGVLNLTDEKPLKDMKRHENTRTLHYKMRKDRIRIDTICFIYLGIIITAAINNQLEEKKNKPKLGWKPF